MRLWSLSPAYLDRAGLLAAWREGLLARKVLSGRTRGYKHHPQLERFKGHRDPNAAIAYFLGVIRAEAARRGYRFKKIPVPARRPARIAVTRGQLAYEFSWLCRKLRARDPARCKTLRALKGIRPHPLFRAVPGPVAAWEKVRGSGRR